MKAKYYKIYGTIRQKEKDEEMGVVKEIDNSPFIIYKNGASRLEQHIDNFNDYLDVFETKRCTKKEFKKAFDEAINFYKKLV